MQERSLVLVLLLLLNGCIQATKNKDSFTRIVYEKELSSFEVDTVGYKVSIKEDSLEYSYKGSDKSLFTIKQEGSMFLIKSDEEEKNLLFDEDRVYTLNGYNYRVFKLSYGKEKIDGEIKFFFCREFGLILTRSPSWETFTQFYNTDIIELQQLSMLIVNDLGFFTEKDFTIDDNIQLNIDTLEIDG